MALVQHIPYSLNHVRLSAAWLGRFTVSAASLTTRHSSRCIMRVMNSALNSTSFTSTERAWGTKRRQKRITTLGQQTATVSYMDEEQDLNCGSKHHGRIPNAAKCIVALSHQNLKRVAVLHSFDVGSKHVVRE